MADGLDRTDLLELEFSNAGPDTLVTLAGELDLLSQTRFRFELQHAADRTAGRLIVDAGALAFIDASGLRAVVDAHRRFGVRFVLRAASPQVTRLLDLTGLDHLLDTATTSAKVQYVQRLFDAFAKGGVAAMGDIVPDRVEWRPWNSLPLKGTRALREHWSVVKAPAMRITEMSDIGNDVLVGTERSLPTGEVQELWSLYHFELDVLAQATTFANRAAAVAAAV